DDKQLLMIQEISINQSYLWLVDVSAGSKKLLTPKIGDQEIAYGAPRFSKDGRGVYAATDRDSEFVRLAYLDLARRAAVYLTTPVAWDVNAIALTDDGRTIAFVTNEDGIGRLYLLDTHARKYRPVAGVPTGIVADDLRFHKNSRDLGFQVSSAR